MVKRYRKIIGRYFICIALCLAFLFGFIVNIRTPQAEEKRYRILFISSYSYAWDAVQLQIEGIKKGVPDGTVVDYEFMDTKRVDSEMALELFYEGLAYRMSQVEPYDAIILGDDAALVFAMEHKDDIFEGTPFIFEGVNDLELAKEAVKDPQIVGVIESLSIESNIDLALSLYPNATRVVGILDDTLTGEAERKNFYSVADQYPNLEFTEINASKLSTAGLKKNLLDLNTNSILIYVTMTEDGNGRRYTNREAIEMIAEFSPIPAFRMVEGGIGYGVLGGNIVSMQDSGQLAAELAINVIKGKVKIETEELILESPNIYCIDEQVMLKFGLSKNQFPEDTVYMNHIPSFVERNREILIPSAILLVALFTISVWISIDNIRRRKLTGELEEARSYLEDASQHDFLTGLPNRSKFMADLEETVGNKMPCTVIMLDIDNFKHINDTYGHTAGDEALQQVAARLKALRTPLLTPYRFAGDEFIVIVKSNVRKITETAAIQCLQVFQKSFKLAGKKYDIGGSVGAASYPTDALDGEQLIILADDAMYHVKKNGKNAYAFFGDDKK
ncbi:MAG: GGDEF domain-containing protein [Lachnospiraceae bacterium]|nr:GGDEF domain-containing protein [Lachnospiraceae bacterium]